jgi:hypothetical protein
VRTIPPAALQALSETGRALVEFGDPSVSALPAMVAGPLREWAVREIRSDVGMRVGCIRSCFQLRSQRL